MTIILPNLAIAGYRSFGKQPQYFEKFAKVNIFIGQNNAGKSNVLRFLHEVYSQASEKSGPTLDPLVKHFPNQPPTLLGIGEEIDRTDPTRPKLPDDHRLIVGMQSGPIKNKAAFTLGKVFAEKSKIDQTTLSWTLSTISRRVDEQNSWTKAIKALEDHELQQLWSTMTNQQRGDRVAHWEPEVIRRLPAPPIAIKTQLIPAIRQIGTKGSTSDGFDGTGIIERVAKIQNPDVHNQANR